MLTTEVRFYEDLSGHPDLEVYCPRFFGLADPNAFSISSKRTFPSGCGILLEKIPGTDTKLAHLPRKLQREAEYVIERMRARFRVDDPWDGSCFVPGTRAAFTLIDLAMPSESLGTLDEVLAEYGRIPDQLRAQFGLE